MWGSNSLNHLHVQILNQRRHKESILFDVDNFKAVNDTHHAAARLIEAKAQGKSRIVGSALEKLDLPRKLG